MIDVISMILTVIIMYWLLKAIFKALFFPNEKAERQARKNKDAIDISVMKVKTPDGEIEVATTEEQRRELRKQFKGQKIIETRPTPRQEKRNRKKAEREAKREAREREKIKAKARDDRLMDEIMWYEDFCEDEDRFG